MPQLPFLNELFCPGNYKAKILRIAHAGNAKVNNTLKSCTEVSRSVNLLQCVKAELSL